MATTRNRPKAVNISKTAIDQVGSFLQDLSAKPKEELSIREAIDQLREPIQTALAKGYNYDDIVTILTKQGISTTAATVKRYISLGNTGKRKAGTRTKRGRAKTEDTESEAPKNQKAAKAESSTEEAAPKATRGRRKSAAASADSSAQTTVKAEKEPGKPKSTRAASATRSAPKAPTRGRKKTT